MNWNRTLIAIALGGVVGLAASVYVYKQFKQAAAAKPVVVNHVVVAAAQLPLGTRLQPQHLRLVSWPAGDPMPGMFTRIEDCLNRALIASVVENEPLLEGKLAPREGGAGLSVTIPEGMRAVSVQVNDVIGVAGFVTPGTMVDVLVTGSAGGQGGGNKVTRTILEDIKVLAAGQKLEQAKDGKPQTVPVITLLVTPEEANKLTMASTEGRIQLALRNTLDREKAAPPPVYQASLFTGAPPAPVRQARVRNLPPPPPPEEPYAVEVIRGNKREVARFPNR